MSELAKHTNGAAIWKVLGPVLLSALVTGLAFWLVFGTSIVTRDELFEFKSDIKNLRSETRAISDRTIKVEVKLQSVSKQLDKISTKLNGSDSP